MQRRSTILVFIYLLTLIAYDFSDQLPAFAQEAQPGSFTNQLALLAIAPPPGNAGILDLYQIPGAPADPDSNVVVPGFPLSAAWSPDGNFLAFIMITGEPGSDAPPSDIDIYRLDRQGTGLVKLTDTPNCPEIGLAWSADSHVLFFSGFCRDSQATTFWQLDLSGGSAERLGEIQWDGTWAVWSPDLSKIALLAPRKAEDNSLYDEVLLVASDGQGLTILANDAHPGYQLQQSTVLAWSPQNDWLAYATKKQVTDQGAVNQIVLVRPDGSERRILHTSQPDQECLNPLWSPDSLHLAFTCGDNLFTIQSDGADLKNQTSPSAGQVVEYPAWAPDGESLAFISLASDGKRRLESVRTDGTQRHEIADILAVQTFGLAWNPVAQAIDQPVSLISSSPEASQGIISTPSTVEVDREDSLTSDTPQAGQPVDSAPYSVGESQTDGLTANNQADRAVKLSPIWLLGMLLVVGGAGVFLLLRRTGRLPDPVKRGNERKLRRERWERERAARVLSENARPARAIEAGKPLTGQADDLLQQNGEYEETPEQAQLLRSGIQQVRTNDIQGGIATLRQYLETVPDDPTAWLWLGWASGLEKEYRTAERCFLRARRLGSPQAEEALEWLSKQH